MAITLGLDRRFSLVLVPPDGPGRGWTGQWTVWRDHHNFCINAWPVYPLSYVQACIRLHDVLFHDKNEYQNKLKQAKNSDWEIRKNCLYQFFFLVFNFRLAIHKTKIFIPFHLRVVSRRQSRSRPSSPGVQPSLFVSLSALAEYFISSLARGISSPRGFARITLRKPEEIVTLVHRTPRR